MTMNSFGNRRAAGKGGYTLIELMVSIGLFAIVMTLAAGAYITLLNLNRNAQGISTAVDSVSFVLDYMTREIRTGTSYGCAASGTPIPGTDCPSGGSSFSVVDQSGATVVFSRIVIPNNGNYGIAQNGTIVTDSTVNIQSLTFYAVGTKPVSQGDYNPPRVTIVVSGTVSTGKETLPFTVETGAVMRNIDL